MDQPPPPPPHGASPKSTTMPPGNYDIFIIPPHSAGSGFLYLPSMKPNVNSFAAGFASALVLVVMIQSMAPAFRAWWSQFQGMGNMGMLLLVIAVGIGAWSLGRTQQEGIPGSGAAGDGAGGSRFGGFESFGAQSNGAPPPQSAGAPPPPPPHNNPPPPPPPPGSGPQTRPAGGEKPSWQSKPQGETPKGAWEKAREETRRKEEERKAKEAEQKRKEDLAKRLKELREREARERAKREEEAKAKADQASKEKEAKEREQKTRDLREKELKERLDRERILRERLEKEAKDREADRLREEATRKSTYAYSSVGEKTNPWPSGKPPVSPTKPSSQPASAQRPPAPTARTYMGDEDQYSYRPYDQPKQPRRKRSGETIFTESSYAASQSTARTTPPPSERGPYTTKDPDKIVIKAVYSFVNQFSKTPASQLLSGIGHVTDGLILRITTEGLFIDDDVRGVPQREWDVKAWTLKLMESGDTKQRGLHILRATIRDQDGKRYLFVLGEEEGWKVTAGLKRLQKGTQVRQLGVQNMSTADAKNTLEMLGW